MRLNGYPEKLITKTIKQTLLCNSKSKIAEQLKRATNRYGLEVIFTRYLSLKSKYQRTILKVLALVDLFTSYKNYQRNLKNVRK